MGPHMAQARQHQMHPQMFPEAMDDGIPLTPGGGPKMMPDVGMGQTPEPSQMLKHAVVNLINYQVILYLFDSLFICQLVRCICAMNRNMDG